MLILQGSADSVVPAAQSRSLAAALTDAGVPNRLTVIPGGSHGFGFSGGGRDLLQVRSLDYPVFTGSTICSHAYCQTLEIGCPIRVGGLVVRTGDLLHGDANGVTNIPPELASEVADVAAELVAAENHILDYVKSAGAKDLKEFAAKRAAMSEAMSALRTRVSRKQS